MNYTIKQRKSKTPRYRTLSLRFKFKEGPWDYSMGIKIKEGAYRSESKQISDDLDSSVKLRSILDVIERVKLSIYSEGTKSIYLDEFKHRFLKAIDIIGLNNNKTARPTGLRIVYLSDYIEDYISSGEKTLRIKKATSTTYNRLLNKVNEFDKKWDIVTTDQPKLKAFRLFIIRQGLATATVNLMLVRLKTILKNFSKYEIELTSQIISSPHLDKMQEVKRNRVYIKLDELNIIYDMVIEEDHLSKARDLFLIGCYTALRVSDWEIKPSDISEDKTKLIYRTQKTGAVVEIPLHDKLKIVLERNGWMTPVIQENMINPLFKELVRKAGITRSFKTLQVYPDRSEEKIIEAWEGITSHTCRRSFATNMYLKGLPVSLIRAYTGHANDKVFMNYVQASDTEISQQVKLETLNKIFNNEK